MTRFLVPGVPRTLARALLCALMAMPALGPLVAPGPATAQEINQRQHVPPGAASKVNRLVARSWMLRAEANTRSLEEDGLRQCGELRNDTIVDRRPGGERTVVVTKDILNLGGQVQIGTDCRR